MSEPERLTFPRETIIGVDAPCQAFSGICAAVRTFNGLPVVIMAENAASLVLAINEINPNLKGKIDTSLFVPASLIHESVVRRQSPLAGPGIYKDDHEI